MTWDVSQATDDRGLYVGTYTGRKFYPFDPRPGDVCLDDIAHHAAMKCRFGGAVSRFYSVAEHSVYVSRNVFDEAKRYGLLHDAAEAYIGDMVRPLKKTDFGAKFCDVEARIMEVILERFEVELTPEIVAEVKRVDDTIIGDEVLELCANPKIYNMPPGLGIPIDGLNWHAAELFFYAEAWQLFDARLLKRREPKC